MKQKKSGKEIVLLVIITLLAAIIAALLIVDISLGNEVFNFSNPLMIENWVTMVAAIVLLVVALKNYLK